MGLRRVSGEEPRGNSVGYRQICLNWLLGQRAPINCEKLFAFWKVEHCKGGRGGGFDGRRPKSSNKHKQQQKQRQQQAATGTQAIGKAATSSRIRSSTNSTNNNPKKVRPRGVGPKGGEGRRPMEFRLCSKLFFWMQEKFATNQLFIVDDISQKPPGFTRREPKCVKKRIGCPRKNSSRTLKGLIS